MSLTHRKNDVAGHDMMSVNNYIPEIWDVAAHESAYQIGTEKEVEKQVTNGITMMKYLFSADLHQQAGERLFFRRSLLHFIVEINA